jgi:orotidine-5'-phosphate decarboxylase
MTPEQLTQAVSDKKSYLCIGLDPDLGRVPAHLLSHPDPVYAFCREIIEATADLAVAYKPNLAFFEALGPSGWETLSKVLEVVPSGVMTIADAKRGDIGNTASLYAKAFFETLKCDAVTVAPYMGKDSVVPFLQYPGKWVFLLALTSNAGAEDFQWTDEGGERLYQKVIRKSAEWAKDCPGHLGFVVGATRPELLGEIRQQVPKAWFLVPGVGAQGGDLGQVSQQGLTPEGGLLVNSSRNILYASGGMDYAQAARKVAQAMVQEMRENGEGRGILSLDKRS